MLLDESIFIEPSLVVESSNNIILAIALFHLDVILVVAVVCQTLVLVMLEVDAAHTAVLVVIVVEEFGSYLVLLVFAVAVVALPSVKKVTTVPTMIHTIILICSRVEAVVVFVVSPCLVQSSMTLR